MQTNNNILQPWTCQTGNLGPKSRENGALHNLFSPIGPQLDRSPHGIRTTGPQKLSSPIRIEPTRQYNNQAAISELGGSLGQGNFGRGMQMFHPHSLPECHDSICNSSKSMTSSSRNAGFRVDGVDYSHLQKVGSGSLHGRSFDQNNDGKTSQLGLLAIIFRKALFFTCSAWICKITAFLYL